MASLRYGGVVVVDGKDDTHMYAAGYLNKKNTVKDDSREGDKLGYTQWSYSLDGSNYVGVGNTVSYMRPGYYEAFTAEGNIMFRALRPRTDDLIAFPDSASGAVLEGVSDFWSREKLFKKYGLPYKRGILMYGPPGSGKSCTLQIIARDVIERGGIVIKYDPSSFLYAYRVFRDIQPDTQMVVFMEDFETFLKGNESNILNLLDGAESLDKVLFLATTNYPEMLEPRVVNRPSRFDMIVRVPHPNVESRMLYIDSLLEEGSDPPLDVRKYAEDTRDMSLAHLKELFIAVNVLGCEYDVTLKRLKDMCSNMPSSLDADDSFSGQFL